MFFHRKFNLFYFLIPLALIFLAFFLKNQPQPARLTLKNLCQDKQGLDGKKMAASITQKGENFFLVHDFFGFKLTFSETAFNFQENILQDQEEPISLPPYQYALRLSSRTNLQADSLAPVEIRLLIYPDLCQSVEDWTKFFLTQDWQEESVTNKNNFEKVLQKTVSGRAEERYLINRNGWHYQLTISFDPITATAGDLENARKTLGSFELIPTANL